MIATEASNILPAGEALGRTMIMLQTYSVEDVACMLMDACAYFRTLDHDNMAEIGDEREILSDEKYERLMENSFLFLDGMITTSDHRVPMTIIGNIAEKRVKQFKGFLQSRCEHFMKIQMYMDSTSPRYDHYARQQVHFRMMLSKVILAGY